MVRATLDATVTMSNGVTTESVIKAHFEYDEDEPLAFGVIFEQEDESEIYWQMGRDLFIEAFREGSAGSSDVILVDCGESMGMTLIVGEESAVVLLPMDELQDFVGETTRLIPQGRESMDGQIDEFLEDIFE